MSHTTNPSTQSDDNDIDLIGFQALETLVADLGSLVTEVEALAKDLRADVKAPVIVDEARAIDTEPSSPASLPHSNAHQSQQKSRPDYERILATQAAYQTSASVVAYILGKDRAFQMLRVASDSHIFGSGNDIDTSSIDKAEPAVEYRQSSPNADNVNYDHRAHLRNTKTHETNPLSQDINLSVQIHDALLDEKQTGKALLAAKARVKAVWHIWEAKTKRDEIVGLDKKYDDLRAEYGKLEDEAAAVAVQLAAKRCEAREWKVAAYEEDWQSIFDEDVDKE
ncbi:hypothetical protein FNAPI_9285 [Fusarium napiforme]|uniref:Uncharacterized protein n=1 Tax=Fusarium napiforme TaxID=42672 RepID=A0A8H5IX24_9HYPO|nr:hypothetical protein FNAPI_9285 [Fusarium napiforme]